MDVIPKFEAPDHHPLRKGDTLKMWDQTYKVLKIEGNIVTVDKPFEQIVLPMIYIVRKPFWFWSMWWRIKKWWLKRKEQG